ncbi:MAG: hypothetical protein KDD61_16970 [Bdellovibrionales bacterium]|nr:hypothetical protein [Bdellovibrionales bacterium]
MNKDKLNLSIIVPLVSRNEPWQELLKQLEKVKSPKVFEVIFVLPDTEEQDLSTSSITESRSFRWVRAPKGRASQMNRGAELATGDFFWFLHVDSLLIEPWQRPYFFNQDALYYHDLRFTEELPMMRINEWGVWWRSHLLKMPFGDQGFLLSRELFEKVGGYPMDCRYGEDHLLVWKVRQRGGVILALGQSLRTSARKYLEKGWFLLTVKHLWLTYLQAAPMLLEILKVKWRVK